MAQRQVAFRLPEEDIARLDAYAVAKGEVEEGITIRRADAARRAIRLGLQLMEKEVPTPASSSKAKRKRAAH